MVPRPPPLPARHCFQAVAGYDKLLISQKILSQLQNPIWKLYFYFLEFVRPKITELNLMFQSSKSSVHCLHNGLSAVYRELLFAGNLLEKCATKRCRSSQLSEFPALAKNVYGSQDRSLFDAGRVQATTFKLATFLEVCARILYRSCLSDKESIPNWRPDYRDA